MPKTSNGLLLLRDSLRVAVQFVNVRLKSGSPCTSNLGNLPSLFAYLILYVYRRTET